MTVAVPYSIFGTGDGVSRRFALKDSTAKHVSKTYDDLLTFSRKSEKYVFNASGVLVRVAPDEPAFAYDPLTGEALGQSIESAATNVTANSVDISGKVAPSVFTTVQSANSVFQSGSTSYLLAKDPTANASAALAASNNQDVSDGSRSVGYVIVEQGTSDETVIGIRDITNNVWAGLIKYNFNTDAVTELAPNTSGTTGYTILGPETLLNSGPNGGKVVRIGITSDVASGNHYNFLWYPPGVRSTSESIYYHHMQWALGQQHMSSPIITTSSTPVPRAADNLTANLSNIGYNPNEGALVVDSGPGAYGETGATGGPFYMSLAFVGNTNIRDGQIGFRSNSNQEFRYYGRTKNNTAVDQVRLSANFTNGGVTAFRYTLTQQDASINGQILTPSNQIDMTATMPNLTQLYVNSRINTTIKSIRYLPYRLSDSALKAAGNVDPHNLGTFLDFAGQKFKTSVPEGLVINGIQSPVVNRVAVDNEPVAYSRDGAVIDFPTPPPEGAKLTWAGSFTDIEEAFADGNAYSALVPGMNADKPKFKTMLSALTAGVADISSAMRTAENAFDIDDAAGKQLDTLGEWIGIKRTVKVPLSGVYFSWGDTANPYKTGWGYGSWQGPNDPSTGIESLPDSAYRTLLKAKSAANAWDGTIPQLYETWSKAFSTAAKALFIEDRQDMTIGIGITKGSLSAVEKAILSGGYIPLKPAGVKVNAYYFAIDDNPMFAWGVTNTNFNGWGAGSWPDIEH